MSGADVLVRGRVLAEHASALRLKLLVNDLLLLGRVAEGESFIARGIVVTKSLEECDLGLVIVRFSRVLDALTCAGNGWVLGRVAHGSRLVGPLVGDADLARERVAALGLDWSRSTA